MKNTSLLLKKSILGFVALFIFTACDYKKTTIEVGSLFDPTFDFSKTSEFTFDQNYVEVKNGKVQLKLLDLKHEGDDFNNGSHVGSLVSAERVSLQTNTAVKDFRQILPNKLNQIVSYWRFDLDETTDLSTNDFDLIVVNGSPQLFDAGRVGKSLIMDGDDNLEYPDHDSLDFDQKSFSIVFWVNTISTANQKYFSKRNTSGGFSNNGLGWEVGINNGLLALYTNNGLAQEFDGGVTTVNDGDWHHIVVIYNHENNQKLYYIDGALDRAFNTNVYAGNSSAPLSLGNWNGGGFADGLMDEVLLINGVLTSNDVVSLFQQQSQSLPFETQLSPHWTPKYESIVGYWKMDGNWQDSSGNGHHLSAGGDTFIDLTNQKVGVASSFFDGNGDYLSASPSPSFDLNDNFSVSGWFRHTQDGSEQVVFSLRDIINNEGFAIYVDNDSPQDRLRVTTGDGASFNNFPGGNLYIESGQWHHVIYSREGGDNFLLLDGVLEKQWSSTLLTATSEAPMIGARHLTVTTQQEFFGQIDDIAFFNTPLNIAEGLEIYHRQKQKYAGSYDSEIVDLGSTNSKWPDLSWLTTLPFGKELVGDFDNNGSSDNESVSDYSFLSGDLSLGLMGYWNFNEKLANGSPLGKDFSDTSGENEHGEESGGVLFGQTGRLSHSIDLDGIDDVVDLGVSSSHDFSSALTISLWTRIHEAGTNLSTNQYFVVKGTGTHSDPILNSYTLGTVSAANDYLMFRLSNGTIMNSTTTNAAVNLNNFSPDQWYHILATWDGSTMSLYVDANLASSGSLVGPLNSRASDSLLVGSLGDNTRFFNGNIDELALWNRALSDSEIQALYRRGSNRMKFQVKSCADSTCECKSLNTSPVGSVTDCDGDAILNALDLDDIHKAEFIGPGGDGTTYYSELFNRKATDLTFNCGTNTSDSNSSVCVNDEITLGAGPRPTNPVIGYDDFPLEARPDANPYFQYRVYMEADENTACNGSPCLPELTSVNLNPDCTDKFYGALQEIAANKPISYSAINSVTVTADDCATFQLSPNGFDFYYWSTSSWVLATVPSHRSSKKDLETNIVSFSTQFGPGLLYIKSFLETNASQTQNCSIQSIDINYSRK